MTAETPNLAPAAEATPDSAPPASPAEAGYLALAILIEETGRSGAVEGLILGFWDLERVRPRYLTCIVSSSALGGLAEADCATPQEWVERFRLFNDSLTTYDRHLVRELEDHLRLCAFPGDLAAYLALPKTSSQPASFREAEHQQLERSLLASYEELISQKISFPIHSKAAWYVMTEAEYVALAQESGWPMPLPGSGESASETDEAPDPIGAIETTLVVRGTPIISSTAGLVLDMLLPGDRINVRVTDPTPLARRVGEHLGLYEQGGWKTTLGTIQSIEVTEGENRRLSVQIAPRMICEVQGLGSLRVQAETADGRSLNPAAASAGIPAAVIGIGAAVIVGIGALLALVMAR